MKSIFFDTQVLIYALEHQQPHSVALFNELLGNGKGRLVLSEETLFEFSQSPTIEAALALTRSAVAYGPVWLRSFVDIQADEVASFVQFAQLRHQVPATEAFSTQFCNGSPVGKKYGLDPIAFVAEACHPRAQAGISDIHELHSDRLNQLTSMVHARLLTKSKSEEALGLKVAVLLRRVNSIGKEFSEAEIAKAVSFSKKHRRRLMQECLSYATEHHLSDYRTANLKRISRPSDSKDLTISVAAFPYVDVFVTDDGYLHNGLMYVKKMMPFLQTKLIRP